MVAACNPSRREAETESLRQTSKLDQPELTNGLVKVPASIKWRVMEEDA